MLEYITDSREIFTRIMLFLFIVVTKTLSFFCFLFIVMQTYMGVCFNFGETFMDLKQSSDFEIS